MHTKICALATVLAVAGCGGSGSNNNNGGGGGGGVGGTVSLSAANAEAAARAAFSAALGSIRGFSLGNVGFTGEPLDPEPASFDFTRFLRARFVAIAQSTALGAAVIETTEQCDNAGSITTKWNDADDNKEPSTGDTYEIEIDGCDDDDGIDATGTVTVDQLVLSGIPRLGIFNFSARVTYKLKISDGSQQVDFAGQTSTSFRVNGQLTTFAYSFSATFQDGKSKILAGTKISITENSSTKTYTVNSSGRVEVPALNGTLSFETTTPFTGSTDDDYPSSGSLLVRGAGGSTCVLNAVDKNNVTLDVDDDGDGSLEASQKTTWKVIDDE